MEFDNGENCLPPSPPPRRGTRHPPPLLWTARRGSRPKLLAPSRPPIAREERLTTHPLLKVRPLDWNCFCNCCTVKQNTPQFSNALQSIPKSYKPVSHFGGRCWELDWLLRRCSQNAAFSSFREVVKSCSLVRRYFPWHLWRFPCGFHPCHQSILGFWGPPLSSGNAATHFDSRWPLLKKY